MAKFDRQTSPELFLDLTLPGDSPQRPVNVDDLPLSNTEYHDDDIVLIDAFPSSRIDNYQASRVLSLEITVLEEAVSTNEKPRENQLPTVLAPVCLDCGLTRNDTYPTCDISLCTTPQKTKDNSTPTSRKRARVPGSDQVGDSPQHPVNVDELSPSDTEYRYEEVTLVDAFPSPALDSYLAAKRRRMSHMKAAAPREVSGRRYSTAKVATPLHSRSHNIDSKVSEPTSAQASHSHSATPGPLRDLTGHSPQHPVNVEESSSLSDTEYSHSATPGPLRDLTGHSPQHPVNVEESSLSDTEYHYDDVTVVEAW